MINENARIYMFYGEKDMCGYSVKTDYCAEEVLDMLVELGAVSRGVADYTDYDDFLCDEDSVREIIDYNTMNHKIIFNADTKEFVSFVEMANDLGFDNLI